jgi:hypothetical protein
MNSKFGINWSIMPDSRVIDLTVQSKNYFSILTGQPELDKQRSDVYNIFKEGCKELAKRGIRYE